MTSPAALRVLAVSGSLRAKSINTAVLLAAQSLAPADMAFTLWRGLGDLPHFNPDLDTATPPAAVAAWREAVTAAGVLLLCTPEYAHGVPGVLKNALDWLVSYEAFLHQPVAIINARPGATVALASLRETLSVMNARLLDEASVTLPLTSNALDADALLRLPDVRAQLTASLAALQAAVAA
jgi:chromate reductase, NAD(P)H dehydrogenase (quinone)